jgi:hypothetical protein
MELTKITYIIFEDGHMAYAVRINKFIRSQH